MDYQEALDKIHSFDVFGSRLGLDRMKKILSLLGDPHKDMKIIHVAGTNGKGSVCRYIYSVLTECGYKVGLYSSPYLQRFTERMECCGSEISGDKLGIYTQEALEAVDRMTAQGFESPTEFELVTAIAFLYFRDQNADFVILEVGLGGTGDSTNVCDRPLATAITSISYDHMNRLGSTLEEIAANKAGIIKAGVPVTVMAEDPAAFGVIAGKARELEALLADMREAAVRVDYSDIRGSRFSVSLPLAGPVKSEAGPVLDSGERVPAVCEDTCAATGQNHAFMDFEDIEITMKGGHQIENAVCALSVLAQLMKAGFEIPDSAVKAGMKKAMQPGRFEIIRRDPYLILDGAHNIAGIRALTAALKKYFPEKRILLCTGILADKEFGPMARELSSLKADVITVKVPNPRTMEAEDLAGVFAECRPYASGECRLEAAGDWQKAAELAESRAGDYDVTVWPGSLYLIGAVRGHYQGKGIIAGR